jgi:NhaA family Na+:H+ antiporter
LERLGHGLHAWVSLLILPLFALANAGVSLAGFGLAGLSEPVTLGVVAGLVIGKPVGICLAAWISVRTRLARVPAGLNWGQITGVALLGGIGFTMSLFIGALAFGQSSALVATKIGVILASLVAGILGGAVLLRQSPDDEDGAD